MAIRLRFAYDLSTDDYDVARSILSNIEESMSHYDGSFEDPELSLELFSSGVEDLEVRSASIHIKDATRWEREALDIGGSDTCAVVWIDEEPIAWTDDYGTVQWFPGIRQEVFDRQITTLVDRAFTIYHAYNHA